MNRAQKIMSVIERPVYVTSNEVARAIRTLVGKGDMEVKSAEGSDVYHGNGEWGARDFEDTDALVTYSGCIDVVIDPDGDVKVDVWNGDNMYGERTTVRSSYTLTGKWWKIVPLVKAVEAGLVRHTEYVLERQEAAEREARRQAIEDQLMGE